MIKNSRLIEDVGAIIRVFLYYEHLGRTAFQEDSRVVCQCGSGDSMVWRQGNGRIVGLLGNNMIVDDLQEVGIKERYELR